MSDIGRTVQRCRTVARRWRMQNVRTEHLAAQGRDRRRSTDMATGGRLRGGNSGRDTRRSSSTRRSFGELPASPTNVCVFIGNGRIVSTPPAGPTCGWSYGGWTGPQRLSTCDPGPSCRTVRIIDWGELGRVQNGFLRPEFGFFAPCLRRACDRQLNQIVDLTPYLTLCVDISRLVVEDAQKV